jgi:DNA polymerase sigma
MYKPFEVSIEVFINKIVDPYNTWLMQTYAMLDIRFLKLALVLKAWNKKVNMSMGTNKLNSYSITLMLIGFLQFKNVLPCLQQIGLDEKNPQKTEKMVQYDKFIYES